VGLFLFSALVHAYVGLRLVPALAPWPWAMVALTLLLVASAVLMPMGLLARRVQSRALAQFLAWAGLLFMGLFSSLFVLTLLRDVVVAVAHLMQMAGWFDTASIDLADLGVFSAILVPLAALGITALGLRNARRTAAVVAVDVPIAGHVFRATVGWAECRVFRDGLQALVYVRRIRCGAGVDDPSD